MNTFTYSPCRAVAVVLLLAGLPACSDQENPTLPTTDVTLQTTTLGSVLTGEGRKTLYFFAPDVDGSSNCNGTCVGNWPVYYKETLSVGTGLRAADFTTITRADGSKQTAYKGWPLYYYKNDAKQGDVLGENVGNVWYVAKPNYRVMLASRQLVGQDGKNYLFDTKEGTGSSLYLTDSLGLTLYAFANDRNNKNNYTRADLSNNRTWPMYEVSATAPGEYPSALNRADFTTITAVGKTQLTYKGWPLYYFGNDAGVRGSTKGVSVPRPGVWPVVNATSPQAPNS